MKRLQSSLLCLLLSMLISIPVMAQMNEQARLANEYYQQGELQKARSLYDDLKNNKAAIPLIHSNYLDLLISQKDYNNAEKYLQLALKNFPGNLQYETSLAYVYAESGDTHKKEKYLAQLLKEYGQNQYQLNIIAQNLSTHDMYDDALTFLKEARRVNGNRSAFALDMATIYRMQNNKQAMVGEYLNYAAGNPLNVNYVKNIFQNFLKEDSELDELEQILIRKIQTNPDNELYIDLLIWVELQRKNFYGAFVQARSLDKRHGSTGDETMRIGYMAMDNKAWEDAETIFNYVVREFGDSYNYHTARRMVIRAKENKIKNQYPVNKEEIRNLVHQYNSLINEIGENPTSLEAMRSKALLHALYLDEKDSAIAILKYIIENSRAPKNLVSESKLDLGDIYLLVGEHWESSLLYSQVEKANKESPQGYEAKLRNARLSYYIGDFALAKSHLDILKLATTREISNDAIALSLLISNNTAFDSTDQVMQQFAGIELLIFQNKNDKAIASLEEMLISYPQHSLTDEAYWLLSKLYLEKGDFDRSIGYLDKIVNEYGYDILSDDALYKKGTILEDQMNETDKAGEVYKAFLLKYPGSLFAAEARARIRKLRGDFIN